MMNILLVKGKISSADRNIDAEVRKIISTSCGNYNHCIILKLMTGFDNQDIENDYITIVARCLIYD